MSRRLSKSQSYAANAHARKFEGQVSRVFPCGEVLRNDTLKATLLSLPIGSNSDVHPRSRSS